MTIHMASNTGSAFGSYSNPKVDRALDACVDFTERDFADLAVAAADQAMLDLPGQRVLRVLLDTPRPECGEVAGGGRGSVEQELAIAQRRIARLERERDMYLDQAVRAEAQRDALAGTRDLRAMQSDVAAVVAHEVSFKCGVSMDARRAADIAAQITQVVAGYCVDESEAA